MPTLLDYRRRIRSVRNTQQITRAMKFVAAAKLRRAQEGVIAARPYAREIHRVLRSAMARIEEPVHPLLVRRPERKILVLVLTGDRSLCGAFNSNVIRRAQDFIREHSGAEVALMAVGRKGRDAFRRHGWEFAGEYLNVSDNVTFSKARDIAARAAEMYASLQVDAVFAVYNEFKSVLVQRLRADKILPLEREHFEPVSELRHAEAEHLPITESADSRVTLVDYIHEQPPEHIFHSLMPRYVEAQIYRILLESSAAEHGARMAAMDAATNNAGDLIDSLTLEMNKIRQASITKELIEIVSGAASTAF
jgi:F-type H+-transporting ATPase subunit gamma